MYFDSQSLAAIYSLNNTILWLVLIQLSSHFYAVLLLLYSIPTTWQIVFSTSQILPSIIRILILRFERLKFVTHFMMQTLHCYSTCKHCFVRTNQVPVNIFNSLLIMHKGVCSYTTLAKYHWVVHNFEVNFRHLH